MRKLIKKVIHFSGDYSPETTEIIADVASLCRKHKVSIDDINMTTFEKKNYYAMISSCYFPHHDHVFWNDLFKIATEHDIEVSLSDKEEYENGIADNQGEI